MARWLKSHAVQMNAIKKIAIGAIAIAVLMVILTTINTFENRNYLSSEVFGELPPAGFHTRFESDCGIHWMVVDAPSGALVDFLESRGWSRRSSENFWLGAPANGFDKIIRYEVMAGNEFTGFYTKDLGIGRIGNCAIVDRGNGERGKAIFSIFRY